jgi:hypothetical protein
VALLRTDVLEERIDYIIRVKRISERGTTGVHSALVRINEELLERKVAAPV